MIRWAVLLLMALSVPATAEEGTLQFYISERIVAEFTAHQLQDKLPHREVTFFDPTYNKTKIFLCLSIADVMRLGFGPDWKNKPPYTETSFAALDGYASHVATNLLDQDGSCLAVKDVEFPAWDPLPRAKGSPGPFYLAWTLPEQKDNPDLPWPYKLRSISLIKFEERYPAIVPKGVDEKSSAWRGYQTFKTRCVACHSINRQGGTVGPDLNAPKSVTVYLPEDTLRQIITKPSQLRYGKMPDMNLDRGALDDLLDYLKHMRDQSGGH